MSTIGYIWEAVIVLIGASFATWLMSGDHDAIDDDIVENCKNRVLNILEHDSWFSFRDVTERLAMFAPRVIRKALEELYDHGLIKAQPSRTVFPDPEERSILMRGDVQLALDADKAEYFEFQGYSRGEHRHSADQNMDTS